MSRFTPSKIKIKEEMRQTQRVLNQNYQNMSLSGWDEEPSHVFIEKINTINAISRTRDIILQRKNKFSKTKPSFYIKTESSQIDTLKLEALKLEDDHFDKQNTYKGIRKSEPKIIQIRTANCQFQKLFRSIKNGIIGQFQDKPNNHNLRKRTMKPKIQNRPSHSIKDLKRTIEKQWKDVKRFTSSRSCSRSQRARQIKLDINSSERIKSSIVRRRSRMMKFTIEDQSQTKIHLNLTPQTSKLKLINKILKQKFQKAL